MLTYLDGVSGDQVAFAIVVRRDPGREEAGNVDRDGVQSGGQTDHKRLHSDSAITLAASAGGRHQHPSSSAGRRDRCSSCDCRTVRRPHALSFAGLTGSPQLGERSSDHPDTRWKLLLAVQFVGRLRRVWRWFSRWRLRITAAWRPCLRRRRVVCRRPDRPSQQRPSSCEGSGPSHGTPTDDGLLLCSQRPSPRSFLGDGAASTHRVSKRAWCGIGAHRHAGDEVLERGGTIVRRRGCTRRVGFDGHGTAPQPDELSVIFQGLYGRLEDSRDA